jgi:hypothetical protein
MGEHGEKKRKRTSIVFSEAYWDSVSNTDQQRSPSLYYGRIGRSEGNRFAPDHRKSLLEWIDAYGCLPDMRFTRKLSAAMTNDRFCSGAERFLERDIAGLLRS